MSRFMLVLGGVIASPRFCLSGKCCFWVMGRLHNEQRRA